MFIILSMAELEAENLIEQRNIFSDVNCQTIGFPWNH
jgi:hypothetical protein